MSKILKNLIKKTPVVNKIASAVKQLIFKPIAFETSDQYWKERYNKGGNSGNGSYGEHAEYKAKIINTFIRENAIKTVIEFGCGDGNQLKYLEIPSYIGYDISSKAISLCMEKFKNDDSKSFKLMETYVVTPVDLTMSLDVIYHLIEDDVFDQYMNRLFECSKKYVLIYGWDTGESRDGQNKKKTHVRHRLFSDWITKNKPQFTLQTFIPNSTGHFFLYKLTK